MTELQQSIADRVRYSLYLEDVALPVPEMLRHIAEFSRTELETTVPQSVEAVVVLTYRSRAHREGPSRALRYLIFGTFRKKYPVTSRIAESLAPIYAEMNVLPLISPLTKSEWYQHIQYDGKAAKDISRRGLLIYLSSYS